MAKRDFYQVLDLPRTASSDDVRAAYRRLARKYHPDVNQDADAEQRFAEASEAYEVLSDPEKRESYDRFGHTGGRGTPAGGPESWGGGFGGGARPGAPGGPDIGSIFDDLFGGRGGSGSPFAGGHGAPRPSPGQSIEHDLDVTFMTAVNGGTERLRLTIGGETRTIDVQIPPGTTPGTRLRVKGKGHHSSSGGPAGDILLTIGVGNHPWFHRDGLDLKVDIPITVAEAALGTSVQVPLLSGTAEVRVPPGASCGRKLRLRGKGVTDSNGTSGDLYAIITIVAPESLSESGQKAMEQIAEELQNPRESAPWASSRGSSAR